MAWMNIDIPQLEWTDGFLLHRGVAKLVDVPSQQEGKGNK